jgi:hypothetical protein
MKDPDEPEAVLPKDPDVFPGKEEPLTEESEFNELEEDAMDAKLFEPLDEAEESTSIFVGPALVVVVGGAIAGLTSATVHFVL